MSSCATHVGRGAVCRGCYVSDIEKVRSERDAAREEVFRLASEGTKLRERAEACEDVLRSLASWLGNGGYNVDMVDPDVFEEKIRDGIDSLIKRTEDRCNTEAQPVAREEIARLKEALEDSEQERRDEDNRSRACMACLRNQEAFDKFRLKEKALTAQVEAADALAKAAIESLRSGDADKLHAAIDAYEKARGAT